MITITRTFDLSLVQSIMTDPAIYPHITDDGSPSASEFRPVDHPAICYALASDGEEALGVFVLAPQGTACWEIHTCLLPASWGGRAQAAARAVIAWAWENTACSRLITNVPRYNRLALKFAEASGMKQFGVNEKSYRKGGRLHDQILLGLSRPEVS